MSFFSYKNSSARRYYQQAQQRQVASKIIQSNAERMKAAGADERTIQAASRDLYGAYAQGMGALYSAVGALSSARRGSAFKTGAGTAGMVATPAIAASGAAKSAASLIGSSQMAAATPLGGVASASAGNIVPKNLISSSTFDASKAQQAAAKEAQTTAQKKVETEIKTQQSLAPIRQRRKQQAQQQAKSLRRTTGRQALLASPRGGAGFFGGYFK